MVIELTYWYCPVCLKKYGKPKPKRDYQRPDDRLAEIAASLHHAEMSIYEAPVGFFGPPARLVQERNFLVSGGLLAFVYAAMYWSVSVDPYVATAFPLVFIWSLPLIGLLHLFAGYAMLCGVIAPRQIAMVLLAAIGVPAALYMMSQVPDVVMQANGKPMDWNPLIAKLVFAALALHLIWDAWYLYREALVLPEDSWGED